VASLGHVAIGLAARRWQVDAGGLGLLPSAGWVALSLLPDADVVAFRLGIPYHAPLGHRGASHSLIAAVLCGLVVGLVARRTAWGILAALVVASHGLLDAMTDGGLGVAFCWPFSSRREFLPWRPIPVAPLGARFFGPAGLGVAVVEAILFLPVFAYALWPRRPVRAR
jgi:inner membrane protein